MKNRGWRNLLIVIYICVLSCNNSPQERKQKKAEFPKPGTVVAQSEMPVTDDPLNHFVFSIKVVADSAVQSGVYDVDVKYGPNKASGQFTMPRGGENLLPIVTKGSALYTYIIGFKMQGDTTFYDYFEVSCDKATTKMHYLKSYTLSAQ